MFKVDKNKKKYLFFYLTPIQESQFLDIDLFVYRGTEATPFKVCKKEEVDSCFVPESDLKDSTQILVIVDCKAACMYDLKLSW